MDVRDGSAVDVIIFGAGPAGSATALALLGMGYTVLIVERTARIPTRGEGLPGAARAELAALGLWEGFLAQEHVSVWSMQSAWG